MAPFMGIALQGQGDSSQSISGSLLLLPSTAIIASFCLLLLSLLVQLVAALPLDCLVLETDAPALGPNKDAPNVPANIMISAEQIAKIKQLPVEQVQQITTENALKLFRKLRVTT